MFDFSHLPQNAVVSEFSSNPGSYCIWNKPPNCSLIFMLAIGGGGGGARGVGTTSTSGRLGGGAGSSGAISQALFLSSSIPNTLMVRFGPGTGKGQEPSGGGAGGSTVSIRNYPVSTVSSVVFLIANSGLLGSNSSSVAGGAAATTTDCPLASHAIYFTSTAGRLGWQGNVSSTDVSIDTSSPILPGASGGGDSVGILDTGGSFISQVQQILPDIPGGATPGGDGSSGVRLPWLAVGGTGGGAGVSFGGRGGNGASYGAGGGGGGSAQVLNQGGSGGDGGAPYACIIAW
jgi:hypothetical protein